MKSFFGSFFGTLFALFILLLVTVGGAVLLISGWSQAEKKTEVNDGSLLIINLSAAISDAPEQFQLSHLLSGLSSNEEDQRVALRDVLECVRRAGSDSRIKGIFLSGRVTPVQYSSGLAALREIREALQQFKKSGKPVYAALFMPTSRTMYVASVADKIFVDPDSEFLMSGLAVNQLFYADALKKFGVGVQVTRVGKYKSFVEPFLLDRMSPENREQTQALLSDLWTEMTTAIEQARGLPPGTIQQLLSQNGLIDSATAVKEKLGTELLPLNRVIDQLAQQYGEDARYHTFRQVTVSKYLASFAETAAPKTADAKIAVAYAEGEIVDGEGDRDNIGGDKFARQIRRFRTDPAIRAIVLRVNSPGGSAAAAEVIRRELAQTKGEKPVVVSMGSYAASGGYWISTAANRIFAEPATITGSIGVFGLLPNIQKLANDHGFTWDSVETTPYASLFSLTRPKTDAELAVVQKVVDRIYAGFLQRVSEARNLPVNQVNDIAQGRVWSGTEALRLKLVDEFGGLQSAIAYAGKVTGLGDRPSIEEYPRKENLNDKLREALNGPSRPPVGQLDPLNRALQQVTAELEAFRSLNDPAGIYARLPFGLEWN